MACRGTRVSAAEPEIWMAANEAIELAYKHDPKNEKHTMLFGSDFENSLLKIGPESPKPVPSRRPSRPGTAEINLPKGSGERFGRALVKHLRGLERQRRPDIIDFTKRAFYEIKTTGYADKGQVQLESYYKIAEAIRRQYAPSMKPWVLETTPGWYPAKELTMLSPNPRAEYIVCTEATNHARYNGMILYDVHRLPRKRRRQRTQGIRLLDFWRAYDQFRPALRSQLPFTIPVFDPDSPDYVIIVPHDTFVHNPQIQKMVDANMQPEWHKFQVDSWMSRNRLTLDPRVKIFWLSVVSIVGAAAIVVVSAGMAAPVAGTGAVVAVETTVGQAIIVPASIAARVAPYAATATEAISLGSYMVTVAAPAVKATIATAGVVIMIGFTNVAHANATTPPTLESTAEIRVVPINDFTEQGGQLRADSSGLVPDNMYTPAQFKEKFSIGQKVFFDNKQYWVLGQVKVG